jgi:prepilin-type N-terminal cleavage/methylation domain-containing protein
MSAFCRPGKRVRQSGFTLLELLVVMAVIALLTGFVAPSFTRLAERTSHSVDRSGILAHLDELAYRVYQGGRPYKLSSDTLGSVLADGRPALSLPDGWRLDLATPLSFNESGVCSGGDAWLYDPDGVREKLVFVAPACRLAGHDV